MKLTGNLKKQVERTTTREEAKETIAQAGMLLGYEGNRRFWADSCFICPENDRITDEMISRLAARYQEPSSGEEL